MTVAALLVATGGCYFGLPDVDPWDVTRDARLYAGPHPVVAHPPCEAWGAYARSGYTLRPLGDDDGCFLAALRAVRTFGGVLEHPANTDAFDAFELPVPGARGGWTLGLDGGWSCHVEQGHYGHRARKPSWLYAVGCALPSLRWGPSSWTQTIEGMGAPERLRTPLPFRDLLLSIARTAAPSARGAA